MKKLTLKLADFPQDQFIVVSRAKVLYQIESDDSGHSELSSGQSDWQSVEADGSYCRTNEFFNDLQSACVGAQNLREFISYHGVSYWQFLPSFIWPHFFLATQLIEVVVPLVQQTKPSVIRVLQNANSYNSVWLGIVRAVARQYGTQVILEPLSESRSSTVLQRFKAFLKGYGFAYFFRHALRLVLAAKYCVHQLIRPGKDLTGLRPEGKKLVCVTLGSRHWKLNKSGTVDDGYDEQFDALIPAFKENGWGRFLFIDTQDCSVSELGKRVDYHGPASEWRQFSSYSTPGFIKALRAWKHCHNLWLKISVDQVFKKHFKYYGIDLFPALGADLKVALHDVMLECYEMVCTSDRIYEVERPSALVITYETGPWQRALIIQGSRLNIPTIGLQHGMIFENHYDYMHKSIASAPLGGDIGFAVPKMTCVWGDFWRRILITKGYYPESSVAVTGNWRYDSLNLIKESSESKVEHVIGQALAGQRVVAVLTAGVEVTDYVQICLDVLSCYDDVLPIIKLHPSDNPQPVRAMISKLGLSPHLFEGSLGDLLSVSELVISQFSTVVSEALVMDKPVILANLTGLDFTEAYTKSGACLYATNPDELELGVGIILNDMGTQDGLKTARHDFVADSYYQLDGKSAKRVADILDREVDKCSSLAQVIN